MSAAKFITLPVSHYCEKARWALDYCAVPYQEIAQAPAFHRKLTKKYGGTTVPVLYTGDRAYTESSEILHYADAYGDNCLLYSEDASLKASIQTLEAQFDGELGVAVRRWAYAQLLDKPKLLKLVWASRVPFWQACLVPFIIPKAQKLIKRMYHINDQAEDESLEIIDRMFSTVENQLQDGRQYLLGEQFTAADITFAALAAPILLPEQCQATLPALSQLPEKMQAVIQTHRSRPAGQFALSLYASKR